MLGVLQIVRVLDVFAHPPQLEELSTAPSPEPQHVLDRLVGQPIVVLDHARDLLGMQSSLGANLGVGHPMTAFTHAFVPREIAQFRGWEFLQDVYEGAGHLFTEVQLVDDRAATRECFQNK